LPGTSLTADERRRISLLRFPLAMGVVLVHTLKMADRYASHIRAENGQSSIDQSFVNVMVADVFGRESRPLFFCLAALLLVAGLGPHLEGFATKLKHRCRSLAAPYLLWNGLAFLFFVSVAAVLASIGMSAKGFETHHGNWILTAAHALGLFGMPLDYPLWFVRNLMVLVLLAPAIIWMARRAPTLLLAGSLALCLGWEDEAFKSTDSLFFFAIGIVAGVRPAVLRFARSQTYRIVALYLLLALADGVTNYAGMRIWQLHLLTLLAGLPALWVLSGKLARTPKVSDFLARLSSYGFLLFAAHGLLVALLLRIFLRLNPPNESWGADAAGFFSAGLVVVIVLAIGIPLRRYCPKTFALLTGGRFYSSVPAGGNGGTELGAIPEQAAAS
jgi:hypothetical protein